MDRPIIALDFPDKRAVASFLSHFPKEESLYVKVGMELFYQEGPGIVTWLVAAGHDVFLDLKLHDIPHTVERAMAGIAKLGVAMTNVHAAGGKEMMIGAKRGLIAGSQGKTPPKLLAVTQLTSTTEEQVHQEQLVMESLLTSVCHYAQLAKSSGLDGVVCSAHEVTAIKETTHPTFLCLTPGIRQISEAMGDQKRVVTPEQAAAIGSDFIVVGRPITQAIAPYDSYLTIKKMWNGECTND